LTVHLLEPGDKSNIIAFAKDRGRNENSGILERHLNKKHLLMKSAGLALFFLLSVLPTASLDGKFCLLMMDAESLLCTPCLEPLLRFCRALPDVVQEERVQGIVVFGGSRRDSGDNIHVRILKKKMAGFIQANSLKFSVYFDEYQVFKGLAPKGISAILFNQDRLSIKKYIFPLDPGQLDELLSLLLDN
jgi:hypothetical protein